LELVRMEGLEPPTCGVEARRSVRLSYIRIVRCFAFLRVSAESDPNRTIKIQRGYSSQRILAGAEALLYQYA